MTAFLSSPLTPAEIAALAVILWIMVRSEIKGRRMARLARLRHEARFWNSRVVDHSPEGRR